MPPFPTVGSSRPALGRILPLLLLTSVACDSESAEPVSGQAVQEATQQHRHDGNAVTLWDSIAIDLMKDPGPVMDSRAMAILHAAMHDAVNGVKRRYAPYAANLSAPYASLDAAVAAAARTVLVTLSPSTRQQTEVAYTAALGELPDGKAKDAGIALGRQSAKLNLDARAGDGVPVGPWPPTAGAITRPVYKPSGKPGDYDFTPPFDAPPLGPMALFPGWGRLKPFGADLAKHRLPGPDPLKSAEYARDVAFVEAFGRLNSRTRTPDQSQTAFFWFEDFPIWSQIANAAVRKSEADPWEAARILALTHIAMFDAGVACFEAKYRFRFWRPYTAIRRADEDGNPATKPGTNWLPLLWTDPGTTPQIFLIPPIPDYPSAAATISAAAAAVLIRTLGDDHRFETTSPFVPNVTRRFESFSQAAKEAGMSRVYGGIHFLRAVNDGARIGKGIGTEVSRLLPSVRGEP